MRRWWGVLMWVMPLSVAAAEYDATVHFSRRVELGLPVSGIVARVAVRPGEHVAPGTVLVALEATPFVAAVEQAQAEVARAAATHSEAARDLRQAQELFDRTVLSAVELENAKLAAQRAAAELQRARARLKQARYELERSQLRAPFEAWVLEVRVQPQQNVVSALAAAPLVVLAAYGEFEARARVPLEVLTGLEIGRPATVRVGGRRYAGRVQGLELDPRDGGGGDGRYEVRVVFTAAERLPVGANVKVLFE